MFEQATEKMKQPPSTLGGKQPTIIEQIREKGKGNKRKSKNLLVQNPHQDGYPDLLVMDNKGKVFLHAAGKSVNFTRILFIFQKREHTFATNV